MRPPPATPSSRSTPPAFSPGQQEMASTRLAPSLLLWIESLSPALPSLNELDSTTGKPKRVVTEIADLNDGVVLADVVAEV